MEKIKVAIIGYGNIGRGVELAVQSSPDMELSAVLSRRDPSTVKTRTDVQVLSVSDIDSLKGKIDVVILCGGSATDLPVQGPQYAEMFNTVDSFDTHAKIPEYFAAVDRAAKAGGNVSVISAGWDPGMFSLNRVYAEAIVPDGEGYTFWGRGVSQGHSDAIRRIEGVLDARQYTVPVPEAVDAVRSGTCPTLTARQKHRRDCFVVAAEGADLERIRREIVTMPNYFADYDTTVTFITAEEMKRNHSGMPHGGFVIRTGKTAGGAEQSIEYSLKLGSNPEFTGSILVACARAAVKMSRGGQVGARTMLDIPPAYLSPKSAEELYATML